MSTNENLRSLSSPPNKIESPLSITTSPLEINNWSEIESKRNNQRKHANSSYITANPFNQDEIIDESLSDRLSTLDGWNSKPPAKFVDVRNIHYSEQEGQSKSHPTEFINIFKNDLTNLSHGLHIMDVKGKQRNSVGTDSNSPSKNHSKAILTNPRRISISQHAESRRASKMIPQTQETQKSDVVLIRAENEKKSISSELVDEITNFRPSTSNMDNLQRGIESRKSQRDGKFQVKPILEMEKMLENATPKDKFSNMNVYRDTIQRVENLKKHNEKTEKTVPVRKATPPKPFTGVAAAYLPSVGQGKKKNFRINNRALGLNRSAFDLNDSYIMRNHKSRMEDRPEISTHNLSVDAIFGASSYPSSRPLSSLLKHHHNESQETETRPRKQSIGKPSSQPIISFDASYFSNNPNPPKETVSLTSSINFVCSILKSSSVQTIEEPKKTPNNGEIKKIKLNKSKTNFNSSSSQAAEMTIKPTTEEAFVPYSIQEVANGYSKILIDTEKRFENLNFLRPGTRSSSVHRGKRSPDGKYKSRGEETGVEIKLYNWPIPSVIPPEKKYEIEKGLKFTRKNELQAAWDKFMKKKIQGQRKEDEKKEESFDYKLEPSGKIRIKNLAFTPNISNVNSLNARKAREEAKDKLSSRRELRSANPSETKRNYYKAKEKIFL